MRHFGCALNEKTCHEKGNNDCQMNSNFRIFHIFRIFMVVIVSRDNAIFSQIFPYLIF